MLLAQKLETLRYESGLITQRSLEQYPPVLFTGLALEHYFHIRCCSVFNVENTERDFDFRVVAV